MDPREIARDPRGLSLFTVHSRSFFGPIYHKENKEEGITDNHVQHTIELKIVIGTTILRIAKRLALNVRVLGLRILRKSLQ